MKKENYLRKTENARSSWEICLNSDLFFKFKDNVGGWFERDEKKFKKMLTLFEKLRIKYEENMIAEIFKGALK